MAIVEDVTEEEEFRPTQAASRNVSEMEETLNVLSKRLALPEELLPSFMHEDKRELPTFLRLVRSKLTRSFSNRRFAYIPGPCGFHPAQDAAEG